MFKLNQLFMLTEKSNFVDFPLIPKNTQFEILEIEDDGITKFKDVETNKIYDIKSGNSNYDNFWCFFLESDVESEYIVIVEGEIKHFDLHTKFANFNIDKSTILKGLRTNSDDDMVAAIKSARKAKEELSELIDQLTGAHSNGS